MVFCRLRIDDVAYGRVKQLFTARGVKVIECTPKEHDQIMARTQALVHFIGRALVGLTAQEISTPDYVNLLQMMTKVTNDTKELFYDMQTLNPYAADMRDDLLRKLFTLQFDCITNAAEPLTLPDLRDRIDWIDEMLVALVGQRLVLAKTIGEQKHEAGSSIQDPRRETEIFLRLNNLAQTHNVPLEVVTHIYDFLMDQSRQLQ